MINSVEHRKARLLVLLILVAAVGCAIQQRARQETLSSTSTPPTAGGSIKLTSTAFKEGEPIPHQYTCVGVNVSPSLEWSGVPKSAKTLVIIADDPDAPSGTWVHWVLYNLPADNIGMVENLPATDELKAGGFQGKNDFGRIGYGGPCPPSGTHRYFFKIYALDNELPLKAGATKADVEKAMEGHVVAQGQLMGTYRK
jgi:Raf kinase inhibitor-like YbhB/YbcL family protein